MSSREPLYITIMHILKERIIDGIYEVGTLIPTENELELEFNVSKITIRKAIELLEYDGYVKKRSGKGTTVLSNAIFNKLSKGTSFNQIIKSTGKQLHKEKTEITVMNLEPSDELYQYFKQKCTRITRMYYIDGMPYIYYTHYLPGDLTIPQIIDDDKFSVYMTLFRNGYYINSFRDEFFVDYPPLKILYSLNLETGPVLGRKRVTYGKDDSVIEIAYAQYNTRISNYVMEFSV